MFNFVLRKTVYKNLSPELRDLFLNLLSKQYMIKFICSIINYFIIYSPVFIISSAFLIKMNELTLQGKLFLLLYLIAYICFSVFFSDELSILTSLMFRKLYFSLCTSKGEALSKSDFKIIEEKNSKLYELLTSQKCCGYCYSICFSILQVLGKGSIKYIAAKNFIKDEESIDNEYTMHVLYVYNDWAFDTFSHRQLPVNELLKIYKCKEYTEFNYNDIKALSYEEFTDLKYEEFELWCKENDVFQRWKND